MKRGRKVVCGSQEGVLDIFDFKDIEDISDRFPGHPASVDALLPLDEDIVLTGSSDGLIRIISILPNKMLGAQRRARRAVATLSLCLLTRAVPRGARRCRHAFRLAGGAPGVLCGWAAARQRGAWLARLLHLLAHR